MFISSKPSLLIKTFFQKTSLREINFPLKRAVYFKLGRDALYFVLETCLKSGRIWVPAFICRAVTDPLIALGREIVFFDIKENLQPAWETMDFRQGDILLLVHFFGIAQDVEVAREICDKHGCFLIEDCCHSLPDINSSHCIGRLGDYSIFSLRKQLPVAEGAFLISGKERLEVPLMEIRRIMPVKELVVMLAEKVASLTGMNILPIKDFLRYKLKNRVVEDYYKKNETVSTVSRWTLAVLNEYAWDKNIHSKLKNYTNLVERLKNHSNIFLPVKALPAGSVPQFLPIWTNQNREKSWKLREKGIDADLWPGKFVIPNMDWMRFVNSKKWMDKSILIPIHENLTPRSIDYMAQCLETL